MRSIRRSNALVFAALLTGCPRAPDQPRYDGAGHSTPQRGGTFVFHHEVNVRGLDPFLSFDELSNMAIRLLYDGLLDYDSNARLIPSLAKQIPTPSADGRTYVFELRSGVRFHDGHELTAESVRWSMERMLSNDVGSPAYTFFKNIEGLEAYRAGEANHISGIRVLDPSRIEFTLGAPDQTFLNAMAMTFAYPVSRANYEAHPTDIARHPVGTGPYKLRSWERGVQLVFERNPHYWRPGRPYPDRMIYIENLLSNAAVMRFRNGDLDAVHRWSPADYVYIKKNRAWAPYMTERPMVNIWGLTMNCEMEPFSNRHLRRAVAFAVDRARWRRARNNRILPAGQPIPPGVAGHSPTLPGLQTYNLDRAREEMRLAGYPTGLPTPVTLWTSSGDRARAYGELAQSDLAKVGITVELKQVSFATLLEETGKPRTVAFSIGGWDQDFPDAADFLDILFHQSAIHDHDSENKAFYRNPDLDALLNRARIEQNSDVRRAMYEQASTIIAEDAPWAFTYNDQKLEAWQPYVRDYVPNPVFSEDYRDLWLDLPRKRFAAQSAVRHALATVFPIFGGW